MERHALIKTFQADTLQGFRHSPLDLLGRQVEVERSKGDVIEDRGAEKLIVAVLKDDACLRWQQAALLGQRWVEPCRRCHSRPGAQHAAQAEEEAGLAGAV